VKSISNLVNRYGGVLSLFQGILLWRYRRVCFKIFSIIKYDIDFENYTTFQGPLLNLKHDERERDILKVSEEIYDELDPIGFKDIKNLWEPNRNMLASALTLNGYYPGVFRQLSVPTNAMEEAISMVNIIVVLRYSRERDSSRLGREMVLQKLKYVLRNCEVGLVYSNNHYFFNLLGILWCCFSLRSTPFALTHFTKGELLSYFRKALNKDGSLNEGSTYYHKYVLESLLVFLVATEDDWVDEDFKKELLHFAQSMLNFLNFIRVGDRIINVGDNDSGRLLPLPRYCEFDPLSVGVIDRVAKHYSLVPIPDSYAADDFGLHRLSSGKIDLFIRNTSTNGRERLHLTSHFHNDQNSVHIYYDGLQLIGSLGTYSYSQYDEQRRKMRSTARNSTITLNSHEQNPIDNSWNDHSIRGGELVILDHNSVRGEFVYGNIAQHNRLVSLVNDTIVIHDSLTFEGSNCLAAIGYLHFSSSASVRKRSENSVEVRIANSKFLVSSTVNLDVINSESSEKYARKTSTRSLKYKIEDVAVIEILCL